MELALRAIADDPARVLTESLSFTASLRRAGSLRDAQSEMRVSANQALGLDGRGEAAAQWIA